jgi:hypothetical protein
MPRLVRTPLLAALLALAAAPAALASTGQRAIIEDDALMAQNPTQTAQAFRALGASTVRLFVTWEQIAPSPASSRPPRHFNASNPAAYPASSWTLLDREIIAATAQGLSVDLLLTGPVPRWAQGPRAPRGPLGRPVWKPNAADFGAFVKAVGTRYDGHYTADGTTLPRVAFWSIWNEPNYGYNLAPQGADRGRVLIAPMYYRSLLDHAWEALRASGHARDTILFGETAPHGDGIRAGNFNLVDPLTFLRALYCVGSNYRPLRGGLARAEGCPATAAASRSFRAQNPALFYASGFGAHLYAQSYTHLVAPDHSLGGDPNYADLADVGHLESVLDRANRAYGSPTRLAIYNTEYGFQTNPPERGVVLTPGEAAYFMNWAEYISYRNPRIASYAQYLLRDAASGQFASGLEYASGRPKPGYDAYMLPLYMPTTSVSHSSSLEVWGGVRPASSAPRGTTVAQLQFRSASGGAWVPLRVIAVADATGYFDVRQTFSHSGSLRLAWTNPLLGQTVYSRTVAVTVR